MPQTMYKLYAAGSSSVDAAAQLDIQKGGTIEAIWMDVVVTNADALNDGVIVEVSFASTNSATSNDSRSSICLLDVKQGFLTTGGGPDGKCLALSGLDIPVGMGERVWMHAILSGTANWYGRCYLYVNDQAAIRPNTRAR